MTASKVDFELPKGTKSYNLYKLHPPFRKLVDGHGYPGVVLEREGDGKLQCHICGEWFDNLSNHIFLNHKKKVKEYKKKFGLRDKDSLVSKEIKEFRKTIGMTAENIAILKQSALKGVAARKKNKKQHFINKSISLKEAKGTLAALNSKGLCPDQVNYRFDIVAAQLGKQPTSRELRQYDEPVLTRIVQTFGTFNKYIEHRGMAPRPAQKRISDIEIIAGIRKIYIKKGRVHARDFVGSPSWDVVHSRFGNLENALRESGIDPSNWTMVG